MLALAERRERHLEPGTRLLGSRSDLTAVGNQRAPGRNGYFLEESGTPRLRVLGLTKSPGRTGAGSRSSNPSLADSAHRCGKLMAVYAFPYACFTAAGTSLERTL